MISRPCKWLFERAGKRMNGRPCGKYNNHMDSHPAGWSVIQTLKRSIIQMFKRTFAQSTIHSIDNSTDSMALQSNAHIAVPLNECMINFMYNPLND